jgi:RND family efflux transporter MFP subunit
MHPDYVTDHPGSCPICSMTLVRKEPRRQAAQATTGAAAAPSGKRVPLYYRSPMDPTVTSPTPAKDSMGMDFVPVYADTGAAVEQGGPGEPGAAGLAPIGQPVELDPEQLRLSGVATAPAVEETTGRTVRAVGAVAADETRMIRVHTRTAGWIEKLFVSSTGQHVLEGQPMLELYSPELLASEEEYLRAREAQARFAQSPLEEVRRGGRDLLEAARRKLDLLGVPDATVDELAYVGVAPRTVTLPAPASGYVIEKPVLAGQRIEPATELFTLADLSVVWVEASLYEMDAAAVRPGMRASVSLPSDPGRRFSGRVAYVYPTLDPATRTLKVRVELANPRLVLKPGMFADVELALAQARHLTVPDTAILDTGERQLVFVATAPGTFVPRAVAVGERSGGRAAILSGLRAGEQVVVRAGFLLDSESRLRAAVLGANGAGGANTAGKEGSKPRKDPP